MEIKSKKDWGKLIGFFFIVMAVAIALISVPRISTPLMVAFIMSMALRPLVPFFRRFVPGPDLSIILTLLVPILFLAYPIVKFLPLIEEEIERAQNYLPRVEGTVKEKYLLLQSSVKERLGFELPEEYVDNTISYVRNALEAFVLKVPNVVTSFLEWLLLLPLFLFFLLRDGAFFKRRFLSFVPNSIFEKTYYLVAMFSKQVGDYISAKFIEATIIGVIITVGLLFMEVRFAITLGAIAAITNIIPYIGPVIGIIPGALVGLIDYGMGPSLGGL